MTLSVRQSDSLALFAEHCYMLYVLFAYAVNANWPRGGTEGLDEEGIIEMEGLERERADVGDDCV